MEQENNSYKQVLKATSLFGGVQFISILVSIIKTKAAALLIGVSGVGIFGIFMSTLNFIQALTRCGLDLSAVKEIASADENDKPNIVFATGKLALITGILGAILVLTTSTWLSQIAFNNKIYTLFFVTISIAVLFNQLNVGNLAILQGLKLLKKLALVITISSLFSLIPTVAIYYYFGVNGIPWVITSTAMISFLVSKHYVDKLKTKQSKLSIEKLFNIGASILKPGFLLSLASITALAIAYIIQIFITNSGGIEDVGLYNAGFALIHSYGAVFFSALSKDFFPRLSEVADNNKLVSKIVNEQAYMLLLLLTPLILIFLVLKPFIVTLLYSKDFLPIIGMITYGIMATLFKSVSWSMGFILIAKGDSKVYLITEIISNLALLFAVIIGYEISGLTGIGLGYLVYHLADLVFIKLIVTIRYKFNFYSNFNRLLCISLLKLVLIYGFFFIENIVIRYLLIALVVIFSFTFTVFVLNKHFNIIELIKSKLKK